MKEILLNHGKIALVDDEDFELVSKWKWYIKPGKKNTFYAIGYFPGNSRCKIFMHRLILNMTVGSNSFVDHINHDGLDNRKNNLRVATLTENAGNRQKDRGNSKYKGVSFCKDRGKWQSYISFQNKRYPLGRFLTEHEAALAYNQKAKEFFGDFAYLNNI